TGRVREVADAADDVRDPHERVIHDDSEVVRRHAIGAENDEVADLGTRNLDHAPDGVVDDDLALAGRADSERGASAFALGARDLGTREPQTGTVVAGGFAARDGGQPLLLELLRRTEAGIRQPRLEEAVRVFAVDRAALALAVRRVRPLLIGPFDARPLVPLEPEPAEVLEDRCLRARDRPLAVGVLDPQDEGAAVMTGEQPVQHRRPRVPHVEAAGRARGESGSDGAHRFRCSWIRFASCSEIPGTRAISSTVAARSARTLPNRSSSAFRRAGPIPGTSSNSLARVRLRRSARLYPCAKRCASSRARCNRRSTGLV